MQVLGIDVLMNCKGAGALGGFIFSAALASALSCDSAASPRSRVVSRTRNTTEPEKQFALVERHVARIRTVRNLALSQIVVMVERNLG
jgi:hypothetical protein